MTISEAEKRWLRANYPTLKIEKDDIEYIKITGLLKFDMVFYEEGGYVIKPGKRHTSRGTRIQDEYQIEITFKKSEHSNLPQVYERGGRIKHVAEERERKLEDLHINQKLGGAACLCLDIEEKDWFPKGFNLKDFFHNLVIPFFYSQSFFEQYGSWPWKQYGHGVCGLLEWYLKQSDVTKKSTQKFIEHLKKRQDYQLIQSRLTSKKQVKGHSPCVCGSEKKFRNCHKNAYQGLWKLKQKTKNLGIEI